MHSPWLTTALKAIPWSVLWAQAPTIIDASRKLLDRWRDAKSAGPAGNSGALNARLAALEQNEKSQAVLLQQFAAQTESLTLALEVVAARLRLALALSLAALVVALAAGVWVLLR